MSEHISVDHKKLKNVEYRYGTCFIVLIMSRSWPGNKLGGHVGANRSEA